MRQRRSGIISPRHEYVSLTDVCAGRCCFSRRSGKTQFWKIAQYKNGNDFEGTSRRYSARRYCFGKTLTTVHRVMGMTGAAMPQKNLTTLVQMGINRGCFDRVFVALYDISAVNSRPNRSHSPASPSRIAGVSSRSSPHPPFPVQCCGGNQGHRVGLRSRGPVV